MNDAEKIFVFCLQMLICWESSPEEARKEIMAVASAERIGALGREGLLRAGLYTACAYHNTLE